MCFLRGTDGGLNLKAVGLEKIQAVLIAREMFTRKAGRPNIHVYNLILAVITVAYGTRVLLAERPPKFTLRVATQQTSTAQRHTSNARNVYSLNTNAIHCT
jgi:hypothetical protein